MTTGEKLLLALEADLDAGQLIISLLLDLNEIQRIRLARVLIEGIPTCREVHFELGRICRRKLKRTNQEIKEIDE